MLVAVVILVVILVCVWLCASLLAPLLLLPVTGTGTVDREARQPCARLRDVSIPSDTAGSATGINTQNLLKCRRLLILKPSFSAVFYRSLEKLKVTDGACGAFGFLKFNSNSATV